MLGGDLRRIDDFPLTIMYMLPLVFGLFGFFYLFLDVLCLSRTLHFPDAGKNPYPSPRTTSAVFDVTFVYFIMKIALSLQTRLHLLAYHIYYCFLRSLLQVPLQAHGVAD